MKRSNVLCTLLLIFVLAMSTGCIHNTTRTDNSMQVEYSAIPATNRVATGIYSYAGECSTFGESDQRMAPLAVAAITPLIAYAADFSVKYIGKKIEEKKKDLTGQFSSTGRLNNFVGQNGDSCVLIVRGSRKTKTDKSEQDGSKGYGENEIKWLQTNGWSNPNFYLLIDAKLADDVISMQPYKLNYGNTSAKNKGSGKKNVTLALALNLEGLLPETEINSDSALAKFKHDFGKLEIGKSYDKNLLEGTSSYYRLLKKTPEAKSTEFPFEKLQDKTVFATSLVTESEDPGLALQAMSDAFDSKKDDLQKSLEALLLKLAGIEEKEDEAPEE